MSIAKRIRLKKEQGQYISVAEYAALEVVKQMHEAEGKDGSVTTLQSGQSHSEAIH
jgi:hypothetical protein